jgi:hypothetical protein
VLRQLQALLATWTGTCTVCGQRIDTRPRAPTQRSTTRYSSRRSLDLDWLKRAATA